MGQALENPVASPSYDEARPHGGCGFSRRPPQPTGEHLHTLASDLMQA